MQTRLVRESHEMIPIIISQFSISIQQKCKHKYFPYLAEEKSLNLNNWVKTHTKHCALFSIDRIVEQANRQQQLSGGKMEKQI